jgi:tetratricopeptide (TPR) repeat protein
MQLPEYKGPTPEAFRGFIDGVQSLRDYLETNNGEKLVKAEKQLSESLVADPYFIPAKYYKAIVLTHERRSNEAIPLLEQLREADPPFKAEVLYNLAFAYSREYEHRRFQEALVAINEAESLAGSPLSRWSSKAKRPDLVLLARAMKAFVIAAFAGRTYGREDDLNERRLRLPESVRLSEGVLADGRLKSMPPETRKAIEVEAHNAAGIAYMRMGQFPDLFKPPVQSPNKGDAPLRPDLYGKSSDDYWKKADEHYQLVLSLQPGHVRVLDNISTFNLIKAHQSAKANDNKSVLEFAERAKKAAVEALDLNPHDQFRYYNLAKAHIILGEWAEANEATKKIRTEHGRVSEEDIQLLDQSIDARNASPILSRSDAERA